MPRTTFIPVLLTAAWLAQAGPARAEPAAGWIVAESAHFTVMTDAGAERGAEIALGLERFRAVFARLAPALELRSPAPMRIFAFRDAASYAPYKAGRDPAGGRILGQFLSHPDGNFITLDADPGLVGALGVVYHEYVHHLVLHNFPRVPLWFNEGLAEYYSTLAVEGERAIVGRPVERHLRWFGQGGELVLDELLGDDPRQDGIAADHGDGLGAFYATSWLLVHHLLSGDAARLDATADFLAEVASGAVPERAFESAYGVRPSRLEDELRRVLATGELPVAAIPLAQLGADGGVRVSPVAPARLLGDLGDLLLRLGRSRDAVDCFHRALEHDPASAEAHAGLAQARELEGRLEEADVLFRDALALAPLSAQSWLRYGRHLLAAHEPLPARAALAQAIALEPNYAEAHALFGLSFVEGEGDAVTGLRALERAHELAPARMEVVFYQVQLLLARRQLARAEALIEGVLEPWAEPEVTARARDAFERAELLVQSEAAAGAATEPPL